MTRALPYEWHDTPNIRVGTYADFEVLARKTGLAVTECTGGPGGPDDDGLAAAARIEAAGVRVFVETFPARLARGAGRPAFERINYFGEVAVPQLAGLTHLVC